MTAPALRYTIVETSIAVPDVRMPPRQISDISHSSTGATLASPDHPATIYRPSIVVGDSRTGETQKFDGPYFIMQWLLRQSRHAILPVAGDPTITRVRKQRSSSPATHPTSTPRPNLSSPDGVHAGHAAGPCQLVMPISDRVRPQHPELFTEAVVLHAQTNLGPRLGPLWDHTLCAMANDLRIYEHLAPLPAAENQPKRLTAMFCGSSGRRFKSCQPNQEKCALSCYDAMVVNTK